MFDALASPCGGGGGSHESSKHSPRSNFREVSDKCQREKRKTINDDYVETNECLTNNGGCWQDKAANITACKDTFHGRVCECPLVDGV
ncbi:hypothetical protein JHK82_016410 [Glycine max]|nr:hypothetical protein JHK85_016825 [Glycine max]KAG5047054.1 hypothetical protein JHK86_016460 [Glycine max]KAG5149529.1 hypothetical protein JHK82_016410 [Glycine max]